VLVTVCTLIATIVFYDQLCKFFVLKFLSLHASVVLIKNVLSITPVLNTGGGFSILPNQTQFFIAITILAIAFLTYLLFKSKEKTFSYAIAMILAGAIGNLIDRIRLGAVVDFIDFHVWPVFNIADSFITIGTALLVWRLLKQKRS